MRNSITTKVPFEHRDRGRYSSECFCLISVMLWKDCCSCCLCKPAWRWRFRFQTHSDYRHGQIHFLTTGAIFKGLLMLVRFLLGNDPIERVCAHEKGCVLKTQHTFHKPTLEVSPFCSILFITNNLLTPAHPQGKENSSQLEKKEHQRCSQDICFTALWHLFQRWRDLKTSKCS